MYRAQDRVQDAVEVLRDFYTGSVIPEEFDFYPDPMVSFVWLAISPKNEVAYIVYSDENDAEFVSPDTARKEVKKKNLEPFVV